MNPFHAGKKRQSPRTGFVHGSGQQADTISIYDNFCFAYALLSQRKAAEILEAKLLLLRLLSFQSPDGSFPAFLHDYPRSYDQLLGLKIAPLLLRSLQGYGQVIGSECKEKMEAALEKILASYKDKSLSPLWNFRYQVCLGNKPDPIAVSPAETWDYWVSLQFLQMPTCDFYYEELGFAPYLSMPQCHFEPAPHLIEWACAAASGIAPPRLIKDHPDQLLLAALDKVEIGAKKTATFLQTAPFNLYWKEQSLHSLILATDPSEVTDSAISIKLPTTFEFARDDLFEVSFFCDAAPDVTITIAEAKGTSFNLNELIRIATPSFQCTLKFSLLSGEGDFCGRIFRSNRPGQIACTGPLQYEAFDWKIALRTLRRSPDCIIGISYVI